MKSKILVAFVALLTAVFAFAWQLPNEGLKLENSAKQSYMKEKMSAYLNAPRKVEAFKVPEGFTHEKISVNSVKMELITNKNVKTDRVILQLHGGGYVLGLSDMYRKNAVSQAVLSDAKEVYMLDYRLAPQHVYPAALDDALSAYSELLKRDIKPQNIIIIGDSAGGNLALALGLKLKELSLAQPALYVLISPWATFESSLPSRTQKAEFDAVLGTINKFMYNEVANSSYAGNLELSDPRLSPLNADLSELSPMLIQTGGDEIFLDENIKLAQKLAYDGVDVKLSVYAGMPHVFSLIFPELNESVKSLREIQNFINLKADR